MLYLKYNKIFRKYVWSKKQFIHFIFLRRKLKISSLFLFLNIRKLELKFKYGLYYYYSWLRVGCKNLQWKMYYTVSFLVDFILLSTPILRKNDWVISKVNSNILPIQNSIYTVSKGPMVRKKQSREQFMFKQIFFNVRKIMYYLPLKMQWSFYLTKNINSLNCKKWRLGFFERLYELTKRYWSKRKHNMLKMRIPNFKVKTLLMWFKRLKELNYNVETNFFFLKKTSFFAYLTDSSFFKLRRKRIKKTIKKKKKWKTSKQYSKQYAKKMAKIRKRRLRQLSKLNWFVYFRMEVRRWEKASLYRHKFHIKLIKSHKSKNVRRLMLVKWERLRFRKYIILYRLPKNYERRARFIRKRKFWEAKARKELKLAMAKANSGVTAA